MTILGFGFSFSVFIPMLFVLTFFGKTGAGVVLVETAADDFLDDTGEFEVSDLSFCVEDWQFLSGDRSGRFGYTILIQLEINKIDK